MLVLSRYLNERIMIGEGDDMITITFLEIKPDGKIKLGFDAPKDIPVHREEVRERILREGYKGPAERAAIYRADPPYAVTANPAIRPAAHPLPPLVAKACSTCGSRRCDGGCPY